ncbi:MAG: hypothetical protein BWY94_02396 [Actinobacteria bacterium ADurb.BinA094]|nr:MAG: hypothetical protein BWY94_02396 [Actinobacteria bacterium ADurb.BinA094]
MLTAQAVLQGLEPRRSTANVLGTALANWRWTAVRPVTPKSYSLGTVTGQTSAHSPQPTHASVT